MADVIGPEHDQPFGIVVGKRADQHAVDDAEHGGRGPDANGERQQGGSGEVHGPAQASRGVGDVLTKGINERETAHVSALFLPLLDRAQLPPGFVSSVLRRHAGAHVVINQVLQVVLELVVEFPFYLSTSE